MPPHKQNIVLSHCRIFGLTLSVNFWVDNDGKLTCEGRWDRSCKEFDLRVGRQRELGPDPPYHPLVSTSPNHLIVPDPPHHPFSGCPPCFPLFEALLAHVRPNISASKGCSRSSKVQLPSCFLQLLQQVVTPGGRSSQLQLQRVLITIPSFTVDCLHMCWRPSPGEPFTK